MNVLLVATNLNARVRLESAGYEVIACRPEQLAARLKEADYSAVVIDLDEAGDAALDAMSIAGGKVLGFYSHVDEKLGEKARAAGVDAYPRSRFWRDLKALLG